MNKPRYWASTAPAICDICERPITDKFVDGATLVGPWGHMCPSCHARMGCGIGVGRGQQYEKQPDGKWLKTGG
jgi:hypothetical protein